MIKVCGSDKVLDKCDHDFARMTCNSDKLTFSFAYYPHQTSSRHQQMYGLSDKQAESQDSSSIKDERFKYWKYHYWEEFNHLLLPSQIGINLISNNKCKYILCLYKNNNNNKIKTSSRQYISITSLSFSYLTVLCLCPHWSQQCLNGHTSCFHCIAFSLA